ncbi:hypothetical protein [Oxalicibacterium solurbis]|uniref:hypothetical protein n=1 Tax=Oxalicibacterium solurbis TaxID=69280 RepID=UPI001663427D|nr:hypothetical protein [Oxalicibacterium solurbis]
MRQFISSFRRGIAAFLALSILTSTIAMAAYLCPQVPVAPMPEMAMDAPCASVDVEKPVHCATSQSPVQLALEHLSAAPALALPMIVFVLAILAPRSSSFVPRSAWISSPLGADPPYLRTQRLRI